MTDMASSGNLGLSIVTYDANPNLTLTATVTGLSTSDTEITAAEKIRSQMTTILAQNTATYSGIPTLLTDSPSATFRLTRTDHSICFFSECQFDLTVSSNTTGAIFNIGSSPTLLTNDDARDLGALVGEEFEDSNGTAFSEAQLALLLSVVSAKLIYLIHNPIVASTYRFETWTEWTRGVKLPKTPLISLDPPVIQSPIYPMFLMTSETTPETLSLFHIESKTGWLMYKAAQEIFLDYEPFDYNNFFRVSYVAGERKIPDIIKQIIVELVSVTTEEDASGLSLAGGTFKVDTKSALETVKSNLIYLAPFILGG
jgi:hypothetical protein